MPYPASKPVEIRVSPADTPATKVEDCVVAAAQHGDRDALGQIYEQCGAIVYRVARRLVGGAEAEDLLQQSFLKAFTSIRQFVGQSSFETWLYRVTVNECLQHLRRNRRRRLDSLEFDPVDGAPHPEQTWEDGELLQQALARLDPELRSLFLLREVEQLSYRDIARVLDITEGTVASRLNRARRLLKEYLKELGWEG